MPNERLEGIVLKSVDYSESDRIITFLTRSRGKFSAFAPSARKSLRRFGGGLDLFAHLTLEARPPRRGPDSLWRLTAIELIEPHLEVRKDLRRLSSASYLSELILMLSGEHDPSERIFLWWRDALAKLNDPSNLEVLSPRLDLELMALCGYAPRWTNCLECGGESGEKFFFSFGRGGVCCGRCGKHGEGAWIDSTLCRLVGSSEELPEGQWREVRDLVDGFVRYTLGRQPKSQSFREEMMRGHWGTI